MGAQIDQDYNVDAKIYYPERVAGVGGDEIILRFPEDGLSKLLVLFEAQQNLEEAQEALQGV